MLLHTKFGLWPLGRWKDQRSYFSVRCKGISLFEIHGRNRPFSTEAACYAYWVRVKVYWYVLHITTASSRRYLEYG